MQTLQINNLEVNELQTLIEDSVKKVLDAIQPKEEPTELITRKETASILGITLVTLNSWSKFGKIPSYRIGTRVRYKRSEVLESLNKVSTLKFGRA